MGDLGFVDESGFLHVVGRVKDIIIRGGTNINPYEVESILRTHPGILDACVVARPDPELGELPVAFLVTRTGFELNRQALVAISKVKGLPRYNWPDAVHRLEELTLSG